MTEQNEKWWLNWNYQYANPDVYGPLVGGHTIQEGFYLTLQEWLPAYLAEFNRNLGADVLQLPRSYRLKPDWETLPKQQGACQILVICNGTKGTPQRQQHATRSTWETQMGIYVAGTKDWQETQAITLAYGAAARAAIAQHPGLGGVAETTLWTGEKYLEKDHVSTRILSLLTVNFDVTIANTLDVFGGPPAPQYAAEGVQTEPSLLPPDPVPVAQTANVTVEMNGSTGT